MQQKVVSITPKQFLFQSSVVTRTFSILFILFTLATIILTIMFMTLHTTSKDITGQTHWTGENPYLAYGGIATGILTIVCGVVILIQTVKIFGWSWNTPLGIAVIFSTVSLAFIVIDFIFLFKRECVDPDKYLNQLGQCVCKGQLSEQNGMCVCASGTLRDGTSCLAGCKTGADCPSGQCGANKFCCPVGTVACGELCCDPKYCQTVDGKQFCCTGNDRVCKDKCCPVGSTCIDKDKGICAFQCGPFLTMAGEQCHTQEGDLNTLNSIKDTLIAQDIPEKDDQGKPKIEIQNGKLFFVTKVDPNTCTFNPDLEYTPIQLVSDQLDFKPCIPTAQLSLDLKDAKEGNFVIQIPTPSQFDPPGSTTLKDGNQWKNCRLREPDKLGTDCERVNYATYDYVNDPDKRAQVIREALLQSLQPDSPGITYEGNYCGGNPGVPKEGSIKIVSRAIQTCTDDKEKALFCQLSGGYTNSVATFGKGGTCNAIIDCDQEIVGLKSQSIQTLGTEKVDNVTIPYSGYQDPNDPKITSYFYQPDCPGNVQNLDPSYWPNNLGLDQFRECPQPLNKLQTPSKTDGTGTITYNTYLCSKNTGQMFKGMTTVSNYYKMNIDQNQYNPKSPPSIDSLFTLVSDDCPKTFWDGNPSTINKDLCFTSAQKEAIYNSLQSFSTKPFITSASSSPYRFWVNNQDEVVNNGGGYFKTNATGYNGGFVRVADGCCNMLKDDRPIRSDDRLMYFNDDDSGCPFAALWFDDGGGKEIAGPGNPGGSCKDWFYPLRCNCDRGRCDSSNNYCSPSGAFAIAKCNGDNDNNVAWTWIPENEQVDSETTLVETLTNKKYLYEQRKFKFQKSNCDLAGWYVTVSKGIDFYYGSVLALCNNSADAATVFSFRKQQNPQLFKPKPSAPSVQSQWWIWVVVAIVLLALLTSLYGGYVLSKRSRKRGQKK